MSHSSFDRSHRRIAKAMLVAAPLMVSAPLAAEELSVV